MSEDTNQQPSGIKDSEPGGIPDGVPDDWPTGIPPNLESSQTVSHPEPTESGQEERPTDESR